jgi:hypothetical protein
LCKIHLLISADNKQTIRKLISAEGANEMTVLSAQACIPLNAGYRRRALDNLGKEMKERIGAEVMNLRREELQSYFAIRLSL